MHNEHNIKMSLTNICGWCLSYIGKKHQDFPWKQYLCFSRTQGPHFLWAAREIHSNECSSLLKLYLTCRSWSWWWCWFAENFFLVSSVVELTGWDARNSFWRDISSPLPLAAPFPWRTPRSPSPCVSQNCLQGAFPSVWAAGLILCPCGSERWPVTRHISWTRGIN